MPNIHILGAARNLGAGADVSEEDPIFLYTHHVWNQASGTAIYIPINTLAESTTRDYDAEFLQPLAGEITQVDIFCETDPRDCIVIDTELRRRQPMFAQELWNKVLLRDFELLLGRVTGQLEDLHAVPERRRNRIKQVGRRDEQHL